MSTTQRPLTVPGNRWDLLDGVWPDVPPRVSVVVVHYDQQPGLDRTLDALGRQTLVPHEVLVVDDGSPTAPRVPPHVRLLTQEDRGNRAAAARNLGARHATGDVLAFLDADTAPEPDYLRRLTRLPALLPEALTVGRRRYADYAHDPPGVLPEPQWLADGYAQTRDLLDADDRSYRFVISAVIACSKRLFDEVGGFEDSFTTYGGEDWEWASRAWHAGAVLAHVPDAVAWHDGPDWEGRDATRRAAQKADEVLRLTRRVVVAGSRPRGVRTARADVHVTLASAPDEAAAFLCVDGVLADLPEAAVTVPPYVAAPFAEDPRVGPPAGARVLITFDEPVRVEPGTLRAAVDRFTRERLGTLTLTAADGTPRARLASGRARARERRWGRAEGFRHAEQPAPGLTPTGRWPDLEAWLGGWG